MLGDYYEILTKTLKKIDSQEASKAIQVVQRGLLSGSLVCTIGNGGSSSTASHYVNDWVKGLSSKTGKHCKAICLSDNTPLITAIGNDLDFKDIFSFQIEKVMKKGDILVCVSGSGNSENIIEAVNTAKKMNVVVVGVTGFDGGRLLEVADYNYHVPINDMQIVEDIHSTFGHLVLRSSW